MQTIENVQQFKIRSLTNSVYLPTIFISIGQGSVLSFVPLFAKDLGGSIAIAGLVFAMRGLGIVLFDIPAGLIIDKIGQRKSHLLSIIFITISALCTAFSQSILHLSISVFIFGAATSLWMLARLSFVSEITPVNQRGRVISLVGGSHRIGNFVGPILGGFIAQYYSFVEVMLVLFVGAIGALIMVFLYLPHLESTSKTPTEKKDNSFVTVFREYKYIFLTAGTAMLLLQVLRQTRLVILPLWSDSIGLEPKDIGLIIGLSSAVDMSLFLPVGVAMDRFGRRWAAGASLLLMSLSMILITSTNDFWSLMMVGLLSGFANGLGSGIGMTLGADFAPQRNQGQFLGIWRFVTDIGTSSGPFIIAGIAGIATLGIASVSVGLSGLIGVLLIWKKVPETLQKKKKIELWRQ
ncbi:MAG: MFS transporter [Dehalococcoidia bacterium]|nr:MFS transporter [Dehalococcoidia bacterium]